MHLSAAILDAGILLDFEDESHPRAFQTFESNVLFALRFMVDTDIVGGNWVSLKVVNVLLNTRAVDPFEQSEINYFQS